MKTNKKNTKEIILDIANELLVTKGYNGFSYNDIARKIGIRNAAIHYHFPSKEGLCVEVIKNYVKQFMQWCTFQDNKTNIQRFEAFGRLYRSISDKGKKICLIGMLTAEYSTLPKKLQRELRGLLDVQKEWLIKIFDGGKLTGEFKPAFNSKIFAEIAITSGSGYLKLIRIYDSFERYDDFFNELKNSIYKFPEI